MTDAVCSECSATQFCSAQYVSYILRTTAVHRQPKDIKQKTRGLKLRSWVNWQWTLQQKFVKQGLLVYTKLAHAHVCACIHTHTHTYGIKSPIQCHLFTAKCGGIPVKK